MSDIPWDTSTYFLMRRDGLIASGDEPHFSFVDTDEAVLVRRASYDALRAALESIARQCVCRCEESWTSRNRHSPDCVGHVGDEAKDALDATAGGR